MDNDYSWNSGLRGASSFRLPENEGMGKWVLISLVTAIFFHVFALIGLSRIDVILPEFEEESTLETQVVRINSVELNDERPEVVSPSVPELDEPVAIVPPVNELDMLENIPDVEIDISPDIDTIQVPKSSSAAAGELEAEALDDIKAFVFEPDLPEMGTTEDFIPRATDTQVTVDPGARMAEEFDPDAYADTLRKGAGGDAEDGLFKDFTSLSKMAKMDGNSLLTSKALIGSDLLFDFNSSKLRQSARVSLMKVALLIDKHPKLVCWVEGHTDLIGGEAPNMLLSQRRAMAVKFWLVETLDLNDKQIAVRGFGKLKPLVKSGSQEAQSPNRRVEIKMRKNHPKEEITVLKDSLLNGDPSISIPKVQPRKAIPVKEEHTPPSAIVEPEEKPTRLPPLAIPVEE